MHDGEEQLGFQLGEVAADPGQPRLNEIREDLAAILAEARGVTEQGPWTHRSLHFKKIVFLQLVRLLPDDEAHQLGFDFLEQVERIETLLRRINRDRKSPVLHAFKSA